MRQTRTGKLQLHLILLVAVTFCLSGCRSGQMNMPKLPELTFWKKDSLKLSSRHDASPNPPSKLFDPEPTLRDVPKTAKNEIQKSWDQAMVAGNESSDEKVDPIRQPYRLESASGDNSDNSGTESAASHDNNQSTPSTGLNSVNEAFRNAVRKSKEVEANRENDASNQLSEFARGLSTPKSNASSGWREDVKLPEPTLNGGGDFLAGNTSDPNPGEPVAQQFRKSSEDFIAQPANQLKDAWNRSTGSVSPTVSASSDSSGQPVARISQRTASEFATQSLTEGDAGTFRPAQTTTRPAALAAASTSDFAAPLQDPSNTERKSGMDDLFRNRGGSEPANSLRIPGSSNTQPSRLAAPQDNNYETTPHRPFGSLGERDLNSSGRTDLQQPDAESGFAGQQVDFKSVDRTDANRASQIPVSRGIPESITHGSGSYAPGSLKPLQPVKESWNPSQATNEFRLEN